MFKASLAQKRNYRYRKLLASAPLVEWNFEHYPSLTGHARFTGAARTPDLEFTRATSKWVPDAYGVLREFSSGTPAFQGTIQHENQLDDTDDFSQWTASQTGVTTINAAPNPLNGAVTAALLTGDGAQTQIRKINGPAAGFSAGRKYLFSVYAKAYGSGRWLAMLNSLTGGAYFDLVNGVVGSTSGTCNSIGMEDASGRFGEGWYRLWATYSPTAVSDFRLYFSEGDLDIIWGTAPGTDTGVYLYGPMAEDVSGTGRTRPLPYVEVSDPDTTYKAFIGSNDGIHPEDASTNLCHYSEDFSNWTETGTSVVTSGDAVEGPCDGRPVDKLTDDDGASYEHVLSNTATKTSAATVAARCFIKKDAVAAATRYPMFRLQFGGTASNRFDMVIDTSTGAVATNVSAGTGTIDTATTELVTLSNGDEWWLCRLVCSDGSTNTTCQLDIYPAVGSGTLSASAISATDTGSIHITGCQMEEKSIVGSYIYTPSNASVTRNRDEIKVRGATSENLEWFDINQGTWVTKQKPTQGWNNTAIFSMQQDLSVYHKHGTNFNGANYEVRLEPNAGNDAQFGYSTGSVSGDPFWWATAYAENDVRSYIDGTFITQDTTFDIAMSLSLMYIGNDSNGGAAYGSPIARIRYYADPLPNDDLDQLSTDGTLVREF